MRVNLPTLKRILLKNIAEVKFDRRRPYSEVQLTRRMLCTNDATFLNTAKAAIALNYRPPRSGPQYDADSKNLIITWDVFMQDFRTISVDNAQLISVIPANDKFWAYFTEKLSNMSTADKISFMNI